MRPAFGDGAERLRAAGADASASGRSEPAATSRTTRPRRSGGLRLLVAHLEVDEVAADERGDADAGDGGGDGDAHQRRVEAPEQRAEDDEREERVEDGGDAALDAGGEALRVLVDPLRRALDRRRRRRVPKEKKYDSTSARRFSHLSDANVAGDGVDGDGGRDDGGKLEELRPDLGALRGAPRVVGVARRRLDGLLQRVVEAAVPLVDRVLEVGAEALVGDEDDEAGNGKEARAPRVRAEEFAEHSGYYGNRSPTTRTRSTGATPAASRGDRRGGSARAAPTAAAPAPAPAPNGASAIGTSAPACSSLRRVARCVGVGGRRRRRCLGAGLL